MRKVLLSIAAVQLFLCASAASAQAEYVSIEMEINVDSPAAQVWSKVGGYCAISDWLNLPCEITSGEGGIGTVRSLIGGRVIEVLVAQTDLSYGYTQPAPEEGFYDLYHGFLEARSLNESSTKLIYTLMLDVSNLPDQAAKDANIARRRQMFEGALASMKDLAEQ